MDIAKPNAHGVLPEGQRETVASRGRAYAAISFALGEDGKYRYGVELHYSIGGVMTPIRADDEGFATLDAARTAGLMELLRSWHEPNPSDANSVREELADMRRQIESHLRQPTLF